MAEAPQNLPRWADTNPASYTSEPSDAKKDVGFLSEEKPPFEFLNWLLYAIYTWLNFFRNQGSEQVKTNFIRSDSNINWLGGSISFADDIEIHFREEDTVYINRIDSADSPLTIGDGQVLLVKKSTATTDETLTAGTYGTLAAGEYVIVDEASLTADEAHLELVVFRRSGANLQNFITKTEHLFREIKLGSTEMVINWTRPELIGAGLAIATVGTPALAALNSTDVAFIDSTNDSLRTYRFDGAAYALVGAGLAIATVGNPALAALSSTRVAFVDSTNDSLRAYDWNGAAWSLVGAGLAIATVGTPALAALNSTDVAFFDNTNDSLRVYSFNGATWAQVGAGLSISTIGNPALAALSSTRVAFFDSGNDSLRVYDWNGAAWSLVGAGLSIASTGAVAIAALNSKDIVFFDDQTDVIRMCSFDGATWELVGNSIATPGAGAPALAALNGNEVAFIDDGNDSLRTYRFNFALSSPYSPAGGAF